ncbi:hypothetical protein NMY22_g14873 [Coprinellus aureogranulatus]|nr:hypothetical protein NMY22_g14873 [Coprinellus aureogranulatus]
MTRAQPGGSQTGMMNPELQRQLVSYAHDTVQELRNIGVPDPVIANVESMRPTLQHMAQDQVNFQGMGRNGNVVERWTPFAATVWGCRMGCSRASSGSSDEVGLLGRDAEHSSELHWDRKWEDRLYPIIDSLDPASRSTVSTKCNKFETSKLAMTYSTTRNEEHARKIITLIATVQRQRTMVSSGSPLVIISIDSLRRAEQDLIRLNATFGATLQTRQGQPGKPPQPFMPGHPQPSPMQMTIQQRIAQQQNMSAMSSPSGRVQPQQGTPNLSAQSLRPPMSFHPPPPPRRQPKQPGSAMTLGAMQSPSPIPTASTLPNAPTPNAMVSSPVQGPKSPKTKPKPKPTTAATERRPSKVAPSPSAAAQTPQSQASPEASTSTPTLTHASTKRRREEDNAPSPGPANGPSPPKRVKM